MMKRLKKAIGIVAAAAICLGSFQMDGFAVRAQAAGAKVRVQLKPAEASPFHDTDGDGLGEFEGWGTSLCWWANRIGYDNTLTNKAAEKFFGADGLMMNIGRYNVGGGDHVGEYTKVTENAKAKFYDLQDAGNEDGKNPTYHGAKMNISEYHDMNNAVYSVADADFGITKGDKVGTFQKIGWICQLDGTVGDGDTLTYKLESMEAGSYTVKLLMEYSTSDSNDKRDVAIRVNKDAEDGTSETYRKTGDEVYNSRVAILTGSPNRFVYIIPFTGVQLKEGENTIEIGGNTGWTLNFVKMAVIKSGEEGKLPEDADDEFLHSEHIIRSDSAIPGYATNVKKISSKEEAAGFAQYDLECGYAWDYNWDADKNQMNVLKAAKAESGEDFIAEAFSNSPPYFMTRSGCSSGYTSKSENNLRDDCYHAFALYMADVMEHFQNEIQFQSVDPMNEPATNTDYWTAYSDKQEGCHFSAGDAQSKILTGLSKVLKERGLGDVILSGTDETSIDTQISSYNSLTEAAKNAVGRIDTHTYGGSKREELSSLAEKEGKNLWMSEVDGAYNAGENAGEMTAALGLAEQIIKDVRGLRSSAWILWNAIDMHTDSNGQKWVDKKSKNDFMSIEDLKAAWGTDDGGYWGLAAADHDRKDLVLSQKYYAFGQFSRYIRPGYTIIGSDGNTLAAYDKTEKQVVVVAMNPKNADQTWNIDLSLFNEMDSSASVKAYRTSGSLSGGEQWKDVSADVNAQVDPTKKTVDVLMKGNSITTFLIKGVTYDPEHPVEEKELYQVQVKAEDVSGSEPWGNNQSNGVSKVVDDNYDTFFDGETNGYVILDLKEETDIAAIAYAPRSNKSGEGDYLGRCVGAVIYGSNDNNQWDVLYTIAEAPPQKELTYVYASQFESGNTKYRYIKYANDKKECNLSELCVFTSSPAITEVDEVTAAVCPGDLPKLPETVSGTTNTGKKYDGLGVTWSIDESKFTSAELFDIVEVTGTVKDCSAQAKANVQIVPENAEYMVDCANDEQSATWKNVKSVNTGLRNQDKADQEWADGSTDWGYSSKVGGDGDITEKSGSKGQLSPYPGGWYANKGKNISYKFRLPAGKHDVMLGCYEWWENNGRKMNVYYTADDGDETLLCDFDSKKKETNVMAEGVIELDKEAVVTLTVKDNDPRSKDPILSWITICRKELQTFTEAEMALNDYILYIANAGTTDAKKVPDGYKMGLYQSNLYQQLGSDMQTGYRWGYHPDDANTKQVAGGSSTTLEDSYVYMSDSITFDKDKSGFRYDFQLPEKEREYEVTVGVTLPGGWGSRTVYVSLEDGEDAGLEVSKSDSAVKTKLEKTVTVSDGELNVLVHNPKAAGRGEDPVLSYIIVKAVPSEDPEDMLGVLKAMLQSYGEQMEGKNYSKATKAAYDSAAKTAQELIDENSKDADAIKTAEEALRRAFRRLFELQTPKTYDSITGQNGDVLLDTEGKPVQAHGGQVQKWGDTWYWYGEDKTNDYRPVEGVHLYTSKDLYNWEDQGLALRSIPVSEADYEKDINEGDMSLDMSIFERDPYFKELYGDYEEQEADQPELYQNKLEETYWDLAEDRCVIERPKVLYNEKTGKYVMWFHADGRTPKNTSNYGKARAGVAVSDKPEGPFKLLGTYLLTSDPDRTDHGFDSEGGHVRDMNLFQDDDGTAYVLYSSEGNEVMYIAKLNDTYTGLAKDADRMVLGEDFAISSTNSREAPALFKYQGKYYLITSGTSGWNPNQAQYAVADDILGEWKRVGDPCVGDSSNTTFHSQSTCVIPYDAENGKFIYMGDRWYNPEVTLGNGKGGALRDSRYIWLPVEMESDGVIAVREKNDWKVEDLTGSLIIDEDLPEEAEDGAQAKEIMPDQIDVTLGGVKYENTPVEWSMDSNSIKNSEHALGYVTVTGKLTALGDREFTTQVFCCPPSLVYFVDCNSNNDVNTSAVFDLFAAQADDLWNTVSDQACGDDAGITWGYTSTPGAEDGNSSENMGAHDGDSDCYSYGWWATDNGYIEYSFALEPGRYVVAAGCQEWWASSTSSRGMQITCTSVDTQNAETLLGSGSTAVTLQKQTELQAATNEITVPEGSDHVLVKISKNSGGAPVLSWLGVIRTDGQKELTDWTAFDSLLEDIGEMDEDKYTSSSWAELQKAAGKAKTFRAGAGDTVKQREIRLETAALQDAVDNLVLIGDANLVYYVDAEKGNDNQDGRSPQTAWKTLSKASGVKAMREGCKILLKSGCVWNGEKLTVSGARGTEANPVVIGSYDEGTKPIINGGGAAWGGTRKEELAAVHICNSEHIVIENLEITNWDASVTDEFGQSTKLLSGLVVENRDAGTLSDIVIRNNKIHDVNGLMKGGADKAAGGLIVVVTGEGSDHTGKVKSRFDGLTIESNEVYKVCHEAIYMESVWASRTLVGGKYDSSSEQSGSGTKYQNAGNSSWTGSSDVLIKNNYVHDVAGDGIVPIGTTDALVCNNLVDNSADVRWDYSANPDHAALWMWNADNVTFRYNESCNTSRGGQASIQGRDSMSFDFDFGVQNALYEYNYSHDNFGGFLMLCPGPGATVNNIARYNISINDGLYDNAPMIRMGTGYYGSVGVQIYNNTMYWEDSGYTVRLTSDANWVGKTIRNVSVFNNIFCGPAKQEMSTKRGISYSHNLVYSSDGSAEKAYKTYANDADAVYEAPLFVNTDGHTAGSWKDGMMTLGTADGFQIQEGSPAIDRGEAHPAAPNYSTTELKAELVENTTAKPEYDYYGTKLAGNGGTDIGASEYLKENPENPDNPGKQVDKSRLGSVIETATSIDATKYTTSSYGELQTALVKAKKVFDDPDATQEEVDAARDALEAAIRGLIKARPQKPDKQDLQELHDAYSNLEQGYYTEESYQTLKNALSRAEDVLADDTASQEEISASYDELEEAGQGLTESGTRPNGGKNISFPFMAVIIAAVAAAFLWWLLLLLKRRREDEEENL